MRTLFAAAVAGGLLGLAAAPDHSQAVQFPVIVNFDYCWGSTTTCPHTPGQGIVDFVMEQNGDFTTTDGAAGTWRFSKALGLVEYTFTQGTVYNGNFVGGGCFDGTMADAYGNPGTWAGCKQ